MKPFDIVVMGFTLLERDKRGYEDVLVNTGVFSKLTIATPTRDQKAATIAKILLGIFFFFFYFGIPQRLHSDLDRNFESAIISEMCSIYIYNVRNSRTVACSPRGNGNCEHFNRTLMTMLRTLEDKEKLRWSDHLVELVMIYNATPHAASGISLHCIVFGKEAISCWISFG